MCESIDSLFQTAALYGISIFNGAGDSGSTCLDGSPNTISVPRTRPMRPQSAVPHQNRVLETSTPAKPGGISADPSPTGQGGFGVSKFFAAPAYQAGLTGQCARFRTWWSTPIRAWRVHLPGEPVDAP